MATITENYKEKLKEALNSDNTDYEVVRWIEWNFPELKESEDERIMGVFRDFAENYLFWGKFGLTKEKALAWLEKQGKDNMGISEATKQKLEDNLNKALKKETPESWNEFLEKQGEDNVEPKFKVGDIIKCGLSTLEVGFIDYDKCLYELRIRGKLVVNCIPFSEQDKWSLLYRHKFKVGYIVKRLDDGLEAIVTKVYGDGTIAVKCEDWESIFLETCWEPVKQQSVLDVITQEESLGINSEEYNKIVDECIYGDDKPVWSEEDENILKWIFSHLETGDGVILDEATNWLKFLKYRVQPKQEWSEEDEKIYNLLYEEYKNVAYYSHSREKAEDIAGEVLGWLKSLKERYTWKPSDEHYELEEFAKIVRCNLTGISKAVQELFEAKYLQLTGNKMYGGFKD